MNRRCVAASLAVLLMAALAVVTGTTRAIASTCTISSDASTPATVTALNTSAGTISSASFSPPAGAMLVAILNEAYPTVQSSSPALSVTDSAGGTWTRGAGVSINDSANFSADGTAVYYRYLSSAPGALSVRGTTSVTTAHAAQLTVRVLDGGAASQPAGVSHSNTSGSTAVNYPLTTTQAGSWVLTGGDSATQSTATAVSGTTTLSDLADTYGNNELLTGRQTSSTGTVTPGTANYGWNVAGTADVVWAGQEIVPATTCGGGQAPVVTTSAATGVGSAGATLNGSVNPEGQSTTYQFDYGTTTSYGTSVPSPAGSAGSGSTAVNESYPLSGLSPSTTYHYRIEATNGTGTSYGTDQAFTTSAATQQYMGLGASQTNTQTSGYDGTYPLSDSYCSSRVQLFAERVSSNTTANNDVPPPGTNFSFGPWINQTGASGNPEMTYNFNHVTGNVPSGFTTDQILEWAACKWGMDQNIAKAEAVIESNWLQSERGDLDSCGQYDSYGILQFRATDPNNCSTTSILNSGWGGYPWTYNSTAVNADAQMAYLRTVYDGQSYMGLGGGGSPALTGGTSTAVGAPIWNVISTWQSGSNTGTDSYVTATQNCDYGGGGYPAQCWTSTTYVH